MTANQNFVGGWSPYGPLTPEDKEVFSQAMNGFVGVHYTPKEVSKQVVAGMNYRFKCDASLPSQPAIWEAIVEIFQPLDGKPYITAIHRI